MHTINENDKAELSRGTERFLRLMVLYDHPTQFYPLKELLAEKSDKIPSPIRLDLGDCWQSAA
jgi:HSP90 family molecular chaperone